MGTAPHKPILLMSIMRLYETGCLQGGCISPAHPQLKAVFEQTWAEFVFTRHQCRLALPFFHMRTEPFWELCARTGFESMADDKNEMRRLHKLIAAVSHAQLAPELAKLMADAEARKELFDFLVERYFNGRRPNHHTVRSVAVQTGITAPPAANDEPAKIRLQAA